MFTLALATALAADDPVEQLPWRIEHAEAWTTADRRSTRLARGAALASAVGGFGTLAGLGLVVAGEESASDGLSGAGAVLAASGIVTMVSAPPVAMAGAVRANRSLRRRGVWVSPAAAVAGWTLYGTGLLGVPGLVAAGVGEEEPGFVVLGSAWYLGLVALPLAQLDVNRRGREAAGLEPIAARGRLPSVALVPTGRGVAFAGAL